MQEQVSVISVVSKGLTYWKQHPDASRQQVLQYVAPLIGDERNASVKLAMMVALNRTLDFLERNPLAGEKTALQDVMRSLPEILEDARAESS